jgi:hypothetical protein
MLKVVSTLFQQIMTELNGVESEDRIMTITKKCIKTHEAKGPMVFIGGKYDCADLGQKQFYTTDLSSRQRGRPTSTKRQLFDSNKSLLLGPRWVLDTKTDWPTDRRS